MKTLTVLPSYNESPNILEIVEAILSLGSDYHVCVVDDSSPDGTSDIVSSALSRNGLWQQRVSLLSRQTKDGRGGAVRDGFRKGLQSTHHFSAYIEMDCDFSHDPQAIPTGLHLLESGADVALGVRYPNGTISGWPLRRRVFSFMANLLARVLICWTIPDYTNGFRFYSKDAIKVLLDRPQRHKGFIYLSESLVYLLLSGMKIKHFPIDFKNRERGVSNTTVKEVYNAFTGIFSIAWQYRLSKG